MLNKMRGERDKAVAELKQAHARCSRWVKLFTLLAVITLGLAITSTYFIIEYINSH